MLRGDRAWIVLVPLLVVIVAVIWAVPLAVVGTDGVRLVPSRRSLPRTAVASVLEPRPGDDSVRLQLTDGRVLRVPGVPPEAASALRTVHGANH